MKHLLKMQDLTGEEILSLLNLADQLKYEKQHGIVHKRLDGKTLGMIFEKPSTRTRVSFEAGIYQLGGQALFLSATDLRLGRGELVEDTARTLSRYLDCIMFRTFYHAEVEELAQYATIPVINGLSDYSHPCQVLADLMTMRERKGAFKYITLGFIGDGNNVCNSLIVGGLKLGMTIKVACPKGYEPHPDVLAFAKQFPDHFYLTTDPMEAADGVDVLYTDVWTSMGRESEREERRKVFGIYQINDQVIAAAKPGVLVQHCLPAVRGEEITAKVFEEHADDIFEEAENRLHAQKAALVRLLGAQ